MIRIFGTMTDPSGSPVPGAIIELRAISSTSEVLLGSTVNHKCDQQGAYNFQLAIGTYDAYAQNDRCGDMDYLGTAKVSANSVDGDLHSILVDGGINITPPMLEGALAAAQRAESAAALTAADRVSTGQNAESAKADSAAAKTAKDEAISAASTAISARDSIVTDANDVRRLATQIADQAADVSSKHGDVAAKAAQVSAQADVVSTKHGEVVAKAAQVSDDASATQSARNISVAAADTATQKAASAATHDASAQDAATRAENAASAVVGAVLDGGECDLSTGVYPLPITVAGKKYSTIWYVAVAGTVSGVAFDVGDLLRYTTAKTGYYFKVDAKDDVYSVNGEKGAVTITPEKIGAEGAGVAQQLVDQHTAKQGAHSIGGVYGLQNELDTIKADAGKWPQSGYNSNSSWVKYKDGTMICTISKEITGLTGSAYGVVYANSQTRITYPQEFVNTPVVTTGSSVASSIISWCTPYNPSKIDTTVIILSGDNIAQSHLFRIEVIAIGRWK
ncbi:TPA: prophage tail fiber N-terminal domain-containing protein [Aeromonas veronii]